MTSLFDVSVPTTDTVAKSLPLVEDDIPLPSDPKTVLLLGIFILACLAAAYAASDVILPVVLAIVLNQLLQPALRLLQRIRIPRSLAALILIIAVFAAIIGIGAVVSGPAASWAGKLPESIPKLKQKLEFLSEPIQTIQDFIGGLGGKKIESGGVASGLLAALFARTQHFASGFFETMLILFFLLVSGDAFLRRLVELLPSFKDKRQAVDLSQQVEENVSAYLVTITLMNAAVGFATGIAFWACGLGDPVLWGAVAFLLNYVPIIGPIAGVVLFTLAGLLAFDNLWLSFLPAGIYFLIHLIEGEAVTPMLLARRFTLNPVVVILSLIFWFWMWGIPGAVLAVPMLAITKIICDGVKPLTAIGHFLEG